MKTHKAELSIMLGITERTVTRYKAAGCPVWGKKWLNNTVGIGAQYDIFDTDDVIQWLKDTDHFKEVHRNYLKETDEPTTIDEYERYLRGFFDGMDYAIESMSMNGLENSDIGRLIEIRDQVRADFLNDSEEQDEEEQDEEEDELAAELEVNTVRYAKEFGEPLYRTTAQVIGN